MDGTYTTFSTSFFYLGKTIGTYEHLSKLLEEKATEKVVSLYPWSSWGWLNTLYVISLVLMAPLVVRNQRNAWLLVAEDDFLLWIFKLYCFDKNKNENKKLLCGWLTSYPEVSHTTHWILGLWWFPSSWQRWVRHIGSHATQQKTWVEQWAWFLVQFPFPACLIC